MTVVAVLMKADVGRFDFRTGLVIRLALTTGYVVPNDVWPSMGPGAVGRP